MKNAKTLLYLLVAAAVWLPSLHFFFRVTPPARAKLATALAELQIDGDGAASVHAMRGVNPEWDLMTRTYTVLALANRALVVPGERARLLATIDRIVDATLGDDARYGDAYFLLPYAGRGPFATPESRSLFLDGEIVAMIAARDLVEPRPTRDAEAAARAARITREMRESPTLSGESYPDECWTFCNTTALAGLAMLDRVTGSDHADLARDWVAYAKAHLVDPKTGLLVSSYTYDGRTLDGPEGSSLWMSAHNLLLVDPEFARDQYRRARRELGADTLGFGWAREWPRTAGDARRQDVDSGSVVPLLDASAGSSGLALLGASAFRDDAWLDSLLASLELAGFRDERTGRYRASNDVGDAVLLYALSFGPLWERAARAHGDASAAATAGATVEVTSR
jgi:hypothetical protein